LFNYRGHLKKGSAKGRYKKKEILALLFSNGIILALKAWYTER
jgi:hypothetical protein